MTNLETVQHIYAAFGQGDLPAILECLADDVQWERWANHSGQTTADIPWFRPRTGKAGAAEFFQVVATQLDIREFQVLSLMSGGNQVAAEILIDAHTKTGGHYRDEEIHLWTFNE